MIDTDAPIDTDELAAAFSRIIRTDFPEHLDAINADNATRTDGSCATHDYFEPNEIMDEAFVEVVGRDHSFYCKEDCRAIDDAWDMAKAAGFSL